MAEKPVIKNSFDNYFSPISLLRTTVSWEEPGLCRVRTTRGSGGTVGSVERRILGLGTDNPEVKIPSDLLAATFTFKFRILPEERIAENLQTHLFWYGKGWQHTLGWGMDSWPLFRVYLDARDDHVYLVFDGKKQVQWGAGGLKDTYPFGTWSVDLGEASKFQDWTPFTVWVDLSSKAFKKIIVGKEEVPFPQGYEEIAPAYFYESYLWEGVFVGDFSNADTTNVTMEIDDVEVYTGFHIPQPQVPPCYKNPLLLLPLAIVFGGLAGYLLSERKKT